MTETEDLLSLATLQSRCEGLFRNVMEVSPRPDGNEWRPTEGWHTIRVGSGLDLDVSTLRTWLRLFDLYRANHKGTTLYWKDALHFDREHRELAATFCIE